MTLCYYLCCCREMKCIETQSTQIGSSHGISKRQNHAASFAKVLDGRKQPIRGLRERNGRHYAGVGLFSGMRGL